MTTFDFTLGAYSYVGAQNEYVYSAIIVGHLFIINILLLNFMIAILSTTIEVMSADGSFQYKIQLYNYCERFMLAFETPAYGELVIHAPPLNIFCVLLLPFVVSPKAMEKAS